jgi:hypothetical protein
MIDTHHEGGSYVTYAVYCTLFSRAHCEYGIHIPLARVMLFFVTECAVYNLFNSSVFKIDTVVSHDSIIEKGVA